MVVSTSVTGLAQRATWITPWLIASAFALGSLANSSPVIAQPPPPTPTPPSLSKAFSPTRIPSGDTSTLTFTITNPNASSTLTTLAFSDTLPSGITVAPTPNLASNCTAGTTITGATAGSTAVSISIPSLAGGANCFVSLDVTGTASNNYENTTGKITSDQGTGNTATARLTVVEPPEFSKEFGAATILIGGTTTLTFTISNPNDALTGLAFTDTLPAGLVVATPNGLTSTCGGTVTAIAGSNLISLTGGTLPGTDTCTIKVNVTGIASGIENNSTSTLTSTEAPTANPATASITVVAPPTISKAFGAPTVPADGTTTLTFSITNPNNTGALTGIAFVDVLPAGLQVSTPNGLTGSCGGTITATAGSSSISLTGATLAAGASCTFSVSVTGIRAGRQTNTTSTINSTNGGIGAAASASIVVTVNPAPVLQPGMLLVLAMLLAAAGWLALARAARPSRGQGHR